MPNRSNHTQTYHAIGLMSGTSLDGLDIAYVRFQVKGGRWSYELLASETIAYNGKMHRMLSQLHSKSALEMSVADIELGEFMGEASKQFIRRYSCAPDLIASHGHTVFHQPHIGFSTQIGNGPTLAAITGVPVVNDFRSADVALGGQGAPLVPVGDRLLFGDYDFCLNLGGIANISFEHKGARVAFDITACNLVLNHLAGILARPYDKDGALAKEGNADADLLDSFNALPYFQQSFPKSLGREWVEKAMLPVLEKAELRVRDKLHTTCLHIAQQVAQAVGQAGQLPKGRSRRMLITGGGAFNKFLVEQINLYNSRLNVTVPDTRLISFKEALVFALLGVLRVRKEPNALRSVTGAQRDACTGALHEP